MVDPPAAFAVKADIQDREAARFAFAAHKIMYGGRTIAAGDTVFLFAAERTGGEGLFAQAVVTDSTPVPPVVGLARQTPRVSIALRRTATSSRPLGRSSLRLFQRWADRRPS